VTDDGHWLRLFPVPWRFLQTDQRFLKYQWVEVDVVKASDHRPESYKIVKDGIRILSRPLSTADAWRARKRIVFPQLSASLCELIRNRNKNKHPTLGFFRPESIEALLISPAKSQTWTPEQQVVLRQQELFDKRPKQILEKIPFDFRYEFRCSDAQCPGHRLKCTDWELGESFRKWRPEYGEAWEAKFREKFEAYMIRRDTHFFVGTLKARPHIWLICGLFYPPRDVGGPTLFPL